MAERFEILEKALVTMLEDKKYATLRDILVTMNPSDVAGLFSGLEEKQIPLLFRLLPKEQAAETFVLHHRKSGGSGARRIGCSRGCFPAMFI